MRLGSSLATAPRSAALVRFPALQESEPPLGELSLVIRGPARAGIGLMVVFIAGSIGWAALSPIAAGAVAHGVISPDGSRRTVQHLEGGIIRTIEARDGDRVKAGDVLIVLDNAQAASLQDMLAEQSQTLQATRARLMSEQAGQPSVVFPQPLLAVTDPGLKAILDGQTQLFEQRRKAFQVQFAIIGDRVRQFEEQIGALQAQVESASAQMALIDEELVGKSALYRKGLVTKSEILLLQRTKAAMAGEHGKALGEISEVQQQIGELATQKASLDAERTQEIATELEKTRTELASISERLNANRDILQRTTIVAPISGTVVNSHFKTDAGVVRAGEQILDIVPSQEQLLIDVRIAPNDIDVVRPDLEAIVHLSAYSSRGVPRIDGIVRSVSADQLVDQATGSAYFLARVEVMADELAALGDQYTLMPGMPAEVTIVIEERTVLRYLIEPFLTAFRRGLREV